VDGNLVVKQYILDLVSLMNIIALYLGSVLLMEHCQPGIYEMLNADQIVNDHHGRGTLLMNLKDHRYVLLRLQATIP
jgi:hypothetical protein